jgi:hypothetical protein
MDFHIHSHKEVSAQVHPPLALNVSAFRQSNIYSSTSLYGASLCGALFIFIIFGACLSLTAVTHTSAEFLFIIFL